MSPITKQVRLAGSVLGSYRHCCAFFSSRAEEYRVLLPFIREGLEQGDRAVHIIDGQLHDDHMRRLRDADIDPQHATKKGQLEIRHWEDAYLQEGCFDQYRMMGLVEGLLKQGRAAGYPLTRLVANMSWALLDRPGVHQIAEYESRINDLLIQYDDAVCCTYDVSRFSAQVIMDTLRVHPMVIMGGILQENPFYIPPAEFLRELGVRASDRRSALS